MKHMRTWLIRVGIILLALMIVLAGAGVWFVQRPWPQISGTIRAAGLQAPVEVTRDKWGVPNIYAQNDHDLFFAQGYVHAQDRLWQMEMIRRLASGTLSEVIGEGTIDVDRYMRTMGLRRVAEQSLPGLDSDARATLEAYAEGVNAYIESHRDRLPLEYTFFGFAPAPWTAADSVMEGNILAFYMSLNEEEEVLRAQVVAKVGEASAQQLFQTDKNMPLIVPQGVNSYRWLKNEPGGLTAVKKWLGLGNNPMSSWGSNNWVVQGTRTATGSALLANDTHLGLQIPSIWYENGLHGGRFDSTGFTFPGVPVIVFGHNRHIAWGGTNLAPDIQDYYIEKLDDRQNPKQYEFMGKWYDLEVLPQTIQVKGSQPVSFSVFVTRHGPLMNLTRSLISDDEQPMALRWTLYKGNTVFNAIVNVNLAANWDEFHAALRDWNMLGQNLVYADVDGNIGYQATGTIPIRGPKHLGVLPVPGWTSEYEWQGFVPYDEMPAFLNPPDGFIATANNQVAPDGYPYQLSYRYYFSGYRALRINTLLSRPQKFTQADMRGIQADTYSLSAQALLPSLLGGVKPENQLQSQAFEQLKTWDLYLEADRTGASVFEAWYVFMMRNTLGDELGEGLSSWYRLDTPIGETALAEWLADPQSAWFDDTGTPQRETRDDIVQRSFVDAVQWLSERYGGDPTRWQWGRVHTTTFVDDPLGRSGIPFLESLVNAGPVASAGGMSTINQADYTWPEQAFNVYHGTSQRMIIDLGNWDAMLAVNSTGQSGNLFHPNFKDQVSMWQQAEYRPVPFTRAAVEKNAEATLTLTP